MNKLITTLTLFAVSLLSATAHAQTSAYAFQISPLQFNGVVSKYPGGNVWLSTPVVVTLPTGTVGAHLYRIYTPTNFHTNSSVTFGINSTMSVGTQVTGILAPGTTLQLFVNINVDAFDITPSNAPNLIYIVIEDSNSGSAVSSQLTLSVIDDRQYIFPSSDTRVIPHLASGAGWRTLLQFTNPNSSPSVLQVNFYNPAGVATPYRLRDGRYSASVSEVVNAYGTLTIVVEDVFNKDTLTGSAEIIPILNQPVGTTIIYETTDTAQHEAALPALAVTSDTLTLAYDNTNDRVTGFVLRNSLNYSEPVIVTYYDDGGTVLSTTTITLPAKGQTAFVITDPSLKNRQGVIRAVMPFKALSGFTLRFDKDSQFIPVLPF